MYRELKGTGSTGHSINEIREIVQGMFKVPLCGYIVIGITENPCACGHAGCEQTDIKVMHNGSDLNHVAMVMEAALATIAEAWGD